MVRMDLGDALRRAAAGDTAARNAIADAYYDRIRVIVHRALERDFRRSHRWILPLFSTGDIVHDVFLGALRNLDSFDGKDDDAFVRYLATVVHNRLIDAVRHHEAGIRDRRRAVAEPEAGIAAMAGAADDPTPSLAASLGEQVAAFREALGALPERERLLLDLRLSQEIPFAEIATRLGYPSSDAARKAFRASRARLLIRLRKRGVHGEADS